MALADPAVITVNAQSKNLVRINQDGYSSEYFLREAAQSFKLSVNNTSFKRGDKVVNRHQLKLVQTVNPVAPATVPTIRTAYVTFEDEGTDDATAPVQLASALVAFANAATLGKLMNKES